MTTETSNVTDAQLVFDIPEDELVDFMTQGLGVDSEIQRWPCPCGGEDCSTFALYGTGLNNGHRILWVILSVTDTEDEIPFGGLDAEDEPDDLWDQDGVDDPWATSIRALYNNGLREVIAEELRKLKAN